MGAAASTQQLYKDALVWFRQYFDADKYVSDFHAIDGNHDDGISLSELKNWIQLKCTQEGGPWKMLIAHPEIIEIAHDQAVKTMAMNSFNQINDRRAASKKVVDIVHFRSVLIQLFAISIFWIHFKKADEYVHSSISNAENERFINGNLDKSEFTHAIKTFCTAYGQEPLSDERIAKDFDFLDKDKSGSISFAEVCNFCCKFADPSMTEKILAIKEFNQQHYNELCLNDPALVINRQRPRMIVSTLDPAGALHFTPNEKGDGMKLIATAPHHILSELVVESKPTEEEVENSALPIGVILAKHPPGASSHDSADGTGREDGTTVAMQVMIAEVEKNKNIAELVEMKLATVELLAENQVIQKTDQ